MAIMKRITLTNFLIASSALGFQVLVLYPWHKTLDEGFEALKKENKRSEMERIRVVGEIKAMVQRMEERDEQRTRWNWWAVRGGR